MSNYNINVDGRTDRKADAYIAPCYKQMRQWICNLTPEVRDILKILWKRGEIAHKEQFLLFSTIFCYCLDFNVKTGTRISLRVKRLFEISEVEITRVDCIILHLHLTWLGWRDGITDNHRAAYLHTCNTVLWKENGKETFRRWLRRDRLGGVEGGCQLK